MIILKFVFVLVLLINIRFLDVLERASFIAIINYSLLIVSAILMAYWAINRVLRLEELTKILITFLLSASMGLTIVTAYDLNQSSINILVLIGGYLIVFSFSRIKVENRT